MYVFIMATTPIMKFQDLATTTTTTTTTTRIDIKIQRDMLLIA